MNFKRFFSAAFFCTAIFFSLASVSCRRSIGYSVLLWGVPEKNLQDGEVVKVYFKSNIGKVYIIALPQSEENFEIPFWQLSSPQSKKKALALAEKYAEYRGQYASIKVDGFPIRAEPVNTAKQVYRLHKDEIVKILFSGEGQEVVMHDGSNLEGKWLCVLTNGGSQGWCFSHNLDIFEASEGGPFMFASEETDESENSISQAEEVVLKQILQAKWVPQNFLKMIENQMIDLEQMQEGYGFDTGTKSGVVSIKVSGRVRSAKYAGVQKVLQNVYVFTDTPFQMIVNSADEIVVNYTGEEKPEAYTFVTLPSDYDIGFFVQQETNFRKAEMQKLYDADMFFSNSFGTLVFTSPTTFSWQGYSLLVPEFIPSAAENTGTVSIKHLISKNFKSNFDGMLTFEFDGLKNEVNFFYKHTNFDLQLEFAEANIFENNVAVVRSRDPLKILFSK